LYFLHAVDVGYGTERANSPAQITAPGFSPALQNQRPALAWDRSTVYVGFGAFCDGGVYTGWLFAFDDTSLALVSNPMGGSSPAPFMTVQNPVQTAYGGGIWMSGNGPAIDPSGNLYVATGNGAFDGKTQFGESVLKLSSRTLALQSYFTPANWSCLNTGQDNGANCPNKTDDLDLGVTGPTLMPAMQFGFVQGSKEGKVYLLPRNSPLPGKVASDQSIPVLQAVPETLPNLSVQSFMFNGTIVWQSNLYVWGWADFPRAYSFNWTTGTFNSTPFAMASPDGVNTYLSTEYGGSMTLSVNNGVSGTSLLWADNVTAGGHQSAKGILYALNADTLKPLWHSELPSEDIGRYPTFNPPLVANGRVYVPSFGNLDDDEHKMGPYVANPAKVTVFGLPRWRSLPLPGSSTGFKAIASGWAISNEQIGCCQDGKIYQWDALTQGWDLRPGGAVSISVDLNGTPFVVNSQQTVFKWNAAASTWNYYCGQAANSAVSVASGANDSETWAILPNNQVAICQCDNTLPNCQSGKWVPQGPSSTKGSKVAVQSTLDTTCSSAGAHYPMVKGLPGDPYVYRWKCDNNPPSLTGTAGGGVDLSTDMVVGGDGRLYEWDANASPPLWVDYGTASPYGLNALIGSWYSGIFLMKSDGSAAQIYY
jgi:hypothetical protein